MRVVATMCRDAPGFRGIAERHFFAVAASLFHRIIRRMNQPRFYCREPLAPAAQIELPEAVARHAVRVLRLPPGAEITLFDGRGGEYPAPLTRIGKDRAYATLGDWRARECESPLAVTLVQA